MTKASERADPRFDYYTHCENEPVKTPEMIQPFGAMVVIDNNSGRITRVSANTKEIIGVPPKTILGRPVAELIGDELYAKIKKEDLLPQTSLFNMVFSLVVSNEDTGDRPLTILAHQVDQWTILEFELDERPKVDAYTIEYKFIKAHSDFANAESESELVQRVIDEIRYETGYEHVMFYRFNKDGAGTVTNESRKDDTIRSFLDHHFPASDIPKVVRDIYKLNPLRIIYDVEALPVPFLSETSEAVIDNLDMTYARLRAVSPVHLQYLHNMGIRSSFSIAIIIDGQLRGIIACLNSDVAYLGVAQRAAIFTLRNMFISEMTHFHELKRNRIITDTWETLNNFSIDVAEGKEFTQSFSNYIDEILTLFDANALFLQFEEHQIFYPQRGPEDGVPLRPEDLPRKPIYMSDKLGARLNLTRKQRDIFAGGILININAADYLIIGRNEISKTILWAGDPTTKLDNDNNSGKLNPRHSFATWKEEVKGRSKPFDEMDYVKAGILRQQLIECDALEQRRQIEIRLREQANTDPLTKLLNRRGFSRRCKDELERSIRYKHPVSLIYFDIDHFKQINDTFGHDAGDEVLVQISNQCRNSLRSNDIIGRLGGEEFGVLLPESSLETSVTVAEKLRTLIEGLNLLHNKDPLKVTISCGVTTFDLEELNSLDKLLNLADKRLYRAKESGRNRVIFDGQ